MSADDEPVEATPEEVATAIQQAEADDVDVSMIDHLKCFIYGHRWTPVEIYEELDLANFRCERCRIDWVQEIRWRRWL